MPVFSRTAVQCLAGCLLVWLVVAACGPAAPETPAPAPTLTPSLTPRIGVELATRLPPTVALVQITPSPLPSATPSPTPTPILFTIAEGDTLLGIALQHGTSVEAIQALNPAVDPYLLQIGQEIVLPPPATPIFRPGDATRPPIDVTVLTLSLYRTPVGSVWLLGAVRNAASVAAENVRVQLSLVDDSGASLGEVTAWVAPTILLPGTTAPFGILLSDPPASLAAPAAAVIAGDSVADLGTRYLDLAVVETAVTIDDDRVQASGRIVNDGTARAGHITLVVTAFDAQDRVSGYRQVTLSQPLGPGEEQPFTVAMAPPGGPAVRLAFQVEARRLPDNPAP